MYIERHAQEDKAIQKSFSDYSKVKAWVLLGEAGAGKTELFKKLAEEEGYYTTARRFITQGLPEDWASPIFIDALDEVREVNALDKIIEKLKQLNALPYFRIACREADWRGNPDSEELKYLVKKDNFSELHLAPLNTNEINDLITDSLNFDIETTGKFIENATNYGLKDFLDNPQTLKMLIKAVDGNKGEFPANKKDVYDLACKKMAEEYNENKSDAPYSKEDIFQSAGYLCAVMLLSGNDSIVKKDWLKHENALHTRLFRGTGITGEFAPVHRTVAEYLGAKYLASLIQSGFPAMRVIALMQGADGGIVSALRGLHAWLAAVIVGELRRSMIERDPLGVVLYGDVGSFTRDEKIQIFEALRNPSKKYHNINIASHPFGALATHDMLEYFKQELEIIAKISQEQGKIVGVSSEYIFKALRYGEVMLELMELVELLGRMSLDGRLSYELRMDMVYIIINYDSKKYYKESFFIKIEKVLIENRKLNYINRDFSAILLKYSIVRFGCNMEIPVLYDCLQFLLEYSGYRDDIILLMIKNQDIYIKLLKHGLFSLENDRVSFGLINSSVRKLIVVAYLKIDEMQDVAQWCLSLRPKLKDDKLKKEFLIMMPPSFHEQWRDIYPDDKCIIDNLSRKNSDIERVNFNERENEDEIKNNIFTEENIKSLETASPNLELLRDMAYIYECARRNNKPISFYLDGNLDWERKFLSGLRKFLYLEKPSIDEMIGFAPKTWRGVNICLSSMQLRYEEEGEKAFCGLSDDVVKEIICFYLQDDRDFNWIALLIDQRKDVAMAAIEYWILGLLKNPRVYSDDRSINKIIHCKEFSKISMEIILVILDKYPHNKLANNDLVSLFLFLLHRCSDVDLVGLVRSKIGDSSIIRHQKLYWFVFGLFVSPDEFLDGVRDYILGDKYMISNAVRLINRLINHFYSDNYPINWKLFLIDLLIKYRSYPDCEDYAYLSVEGVLSSFGRDGSIEAKDALLGLKSNPKMRNWECYINYEITQQEQSWREKSFNPNLEKVCLTLENKAPANAADLWALTVSHLEQIIEKIRNGSTNDYKQYWAEDKPKIENDCRDALLSDLKYLLVRNHVSAEREGNYADDKRADIKVIYGKIHIPIEIKRENHPDIWKAIPEQLIAKYSREIASDGYGIYMVFWFKGELKPDKDDYKPREPQELKTRLESTIPDALKEKIKVLVVDCSLP